jgi:splicing factor 1
MISFLPNAKGIVLPHTFNLGAYTDITLFRSPSPPPTYDAHGRRTNTREVRYRKKLEDERIKLVDRAMKNDPNFRPPVEYHQQKRSQRPSEKVYIPVKEFPEINFFGLLVGPRGNSLKKMERESGAKISIRGKGSVKEGKARPDQYAEDAEEDLHCLVIADSEDKVVACVKMINKVIETVRLHNCSLCSIFLLTRIS